MWSFKNSVGRKKSEGLFALLLLIFIFVACARTQPADFKAGEYRCEFCRMDIVDMRFKAEVLTRKGKVHRFDSIECMMGWWLGRPEEAPGRWVSDFYHPEKWVYLEKAYLLKGKRLTSPMGASLAAFSSKEELDRALGEFGGKALNLGELEDFIRREWKKTAVDASLRE
ncbi:MAG: nitrous oxide reductase accessory protein NosL [bacterium]